MADRRPSPPPRGVGTGPRPRAVGPQSLPQQHSPVSAGSQQTSSKAIGASPSRHGSPVPRSPWNRSLSPRPMAVVSPGRQPTQQIAEHSREVAKAPAARSALQNLGVLPKVTTVSSGASMAGGDDIALLDSLPPTPPETPSPAVAKAAETSLGTSQGSASAAAVQALPMQQCSPAANAAGVFSKRRKIRLEKRSMLRTQ